MHSHATTGTTRLGRIGLLTLALILPIPVFGGTPLICHPYSIGDAKSLPGGNDGHGVTVAYDRKNLVRDTLNLLGDDTPVIVRMETIRRAVMYATARMRGWDRGTYTDDDRDLAYGLLEKLRERASAATGPARALALFDLGFYSETLRETKIDRSLNGYDLIVRAVELRGGDPEMEFALALTCAHTRRPELEQHLTRARAGAKSGTLLAANLESHFRGKS